MVLPEPHAPGTVTDAEPGPRMPQPEASPFMELGEGASAASPEQAQAIRPSLPPQERSRPLAPEEGAHEDIGGEEPDYDRPLRGRFPGARRRYEDDPETPDIRLPSRRGSYGASETELSGGDIALCVLCSGIGCIIGLVRLVNGKPNAGKMIGLSLVFVIIWNIVRAMIEMSLMRR